MHMPAMVQSVSVYGNTLCRYHLCELSSLRVLPYMECLAMPTMDCLDIHSPANMHEAFTERNWPEPA